jgi:hypothetical protein
MKSNVQDLNRFSAHTATDNGSVVLSVSSVAVQAERNIYFAARLVSTAS